MASRAATAGTPIHLYNFDRPIPIPGLAGLNLRATHGAEIAYIFGTAPAGFPDDDVALGLMMQGYWARHAMSGDPNGGGAPLWPAWHNDADLRINFSLPPSLLPDFRREVCDFWAPIEDAKFR
jgi:para-nitrobenzyl esterase